MQVLYILSLFCCLNISYRRIYFGIIWGNNSKKYLMAADPSLARLYVTYKFTYRADISPTGISTKSLPPARVLQGQPAGNSSPGPLCKSSSHFQAYCSGYGISFHPTEGAQIYLTDNCPIYQNISTEDSTNLPPVFLSANRSTAPFSHKDNLWFFVKLAYRLFVFML